MKKNYLFLTLQLIIAAGVTASSQSMGDTLKIKSLRLTEKYVTMEIGDTHQLTAKVEQDGTSGMYTLTWNGGYDTPEPWKSDKPSNLVAQINSDGLVTAVEAGTTVFVVSISTGATLYTDSCVVTVTPSDWTPVTGSLSIPNKCLDDQKANQHFDMTLRDEKLQIKGAFWAMCCQPAKLSYKVMKHTVYLSLEPNYLDSCGCFCLQSFDVEIPECKSENYTVYMNSYANYTIENENKDLILTKSHVIASPSKIESQTIEHPQVSVLNHCLYFSNLPKATTICLYRADGRLVQTYETADVQMYTEIMPDGLYLYRITDTAGKNEIGKVIIK